MVRIGWREILRWVTLVVGQLVVERVLELDGGGNLGGGVLLCRGNIEVGKSLKVG